MSDSTSMVIIFIVATLFILFIFAVIRALFPDKNYEHVVGISLLLLSVLTILASIFFIGGWTGMGIGFIAAFAFGGTVLAMALDILVKCISNK
ncbi:YesK family protein [Bacillus manliponensis]|uniref:YesK family protein n=1 Tax=Bacillus manliponensis TaxID=574376 RepID=UPI0035115AFB